MRVEQLRSLKEDELLSRANEAFTVAEDEQMAFPKRDVHYTLARFYMEEIEKRDNARIGRRDFRMELIVILLIVLEIIVALVLAGYGGRQQSKEVAQELKAFAGMQTVLSNMQVSSAATASAMVELKNSMDEVKISLDKQVALYYDVQLNVVYNDSSQKLVIINAGRGNISLWSGAVADGPVKLKKWKEPFIVVPNGTYEATLDGQLILLAAGLPRDQRHMFYYAYWVKNAKGESFTISGELLAAWHDNFPTFYPRSTAIVPGWTNP